MSFFSALGLLFSVFCLLLTRQTTTKAKAVKSDIPAFLHSVVPAFRCFSMSRRHHVTGKLSYRGGRTRSRVLFNIMASFPIIQLTEGEWTSEKWYDILGVKLPFYFTSDPAFLRDYIDNFQTRTDDVFIVGYPKSGTSTR